jgi:hypothetical protein
MIKTTTSTQKTMVVSASAARSNAVTGFQFLMR